MQQVWVRELGDTTILGLKIALPQYYLFLLHSSYKFKILYHICCEGHQHIKKRHEIYVDISLLFFFFKSFHYFL